MADTDTIVDLVLATVHPKLRERCNRDQLVALLEDLGAYDADGIYDVLSTRSDTTNRLLDGLAPEAFLSRLLRHVAGEPTIAAVSAASAAVTPAFATRETSAMALCASSLFGHPKTTSSADPPKSARLVVVPSNQTPSLVVQRHPCHPASSLSLRSHAARSN